MRTGMQPTSVSGSSSELPEGNAARIDICILSLYMANGILGAAIVRSEEPQLLNLLECQPDSVGFPITEDIISKESPNILIVPARGNREFTDFAVDTTKCHSQGRTEIIYGLSYEFKLTSFNAHFSVDNEFMMAASAILIAMKKSPLPLMIPNALESFKYTDFMEIDFNTLISLQIMKNNNHPNIHYTGTQTDTINQCKSSGGRYLLRQWALRPLKDISLIRSRLEMVEWFKRNICEPGYSKEFNRILRGTAKIETILSKIISRHDYAAFQDLLKFLRSVKELSQVMERFNVPMSMLKIDSVDLEVSEEIELSISRIIDFQQSAAQGRVVVHSRINPNLDLLRQTYNHLPETLANVVHEVAAKIDDLCVSVLNVVYFPQLGFLVTIPNPEGQQQIILDNTDFKLQFSTEKVSYYKENYTRKLDEEIGDIYADIVDMEIEIVGVLVEKIIEEKRRLVSLNATLAQVDCFKTLAEFALTYGLIKPVISEDETLEIKGGRHLLQELVLGSIVENDYCPEETSKVSIITGPNGSGKSIYLKQIGLIWYLAQMGSFVPAKSARIGIVDKLFSRIQTRESIKSNSSAFQTDLLQVKKAITQATKRSLILMDEFGKGTSPEEGITVSSGLFQYLLNKGEECPRVVAITHYHELYQSGLLGDINGINWLTMDYVEDGPITFLFRVIGGRAASSMGIECGKKAGLPPNVINRARELSDLFAAKIPPLNIRFAQINPELEQLAIEIIELVQTMDNTDLEVIKEKGAKFINYGQGL